MRSSQPVIDPRSGQGAQLAAAEIAARAEIKRCFALLRDRHEVDDPATRAWRDAIARWHLALDRIYPAEFWTAIVALKQTRHRDAVTRQWVWSRAPATSVEAAIRFLEADLICFRSGYAKQRLIRHLVRQPLGDDAVRRLEAVVLRTLSDPTRREFRAICRLAVRVCDDDLMAGIDRLAGADDPATARRAAWMRSAIPKGEARRRGPPAAVRTPIGFLPSNRPREAHSPVSTA